MAREQGKIRVVAHSEVAKLLEQANDRPLLLEQNGQLYRLERVETFEGNSWRGYDAGKVRRAVKQTAGTWADIDTDGLLSKLYRARQEGSRPADRP